MILPAGCAGRLGFIRWIAVGRLRLTKLNEPDVFWIGSIDWLGVKLKENYDYQKKPDCKMGTTGSDEGEGVDNNVVFTVHSGLSIKGGFEPHLTI